MIPNDRLLDVVEVRFPRSAGQFKQPAPSLPRSRDSSPATEVAYRIARFWRTHVQLLLCSPAPASTNPLVLSLFPAGAAHLTSHVPLPTDPISPQFCAPDAPISPLPLPLLSSLRRAPRSKRRSCSPTMCSARVCRASPISSRHARPPPRPPRLSARWSHSTRLWHTRTSSSEKSNGPFHFCGPSLTFPSIFSYPPHPLPSQIPGLVNVDFADVRAVMCNSGTAMLGALSAPTVPTSPSHCSR